MPNIRLTLTLSTIAVAAAALAGCSAASPTGSTDTASTEDQAYDKWFADFQSCMSKAGFEVSNDGPGYRGDRKSEYEAASKDCSKQAGKNPLDRGDLTAEDLADMKIYAAASDKCFRSLGYDVPTYDVEAGDSIQIPRGATDDDTTRCEAAADKAVNAAKG